MEKDEVKNILKRQREFFQNGQTRKLSFRLEQLKKLRHAIIKSEAQIIAAFKEDLNKSEVEAYTCEIGVVLHEIYYILKRLKTWIKPQKVKTPLSVFPGSSYIYSEPYGMALIIAPWNYPFQLLILPLLGAIAAGNCSILKPSEYAPYTSRVVARMIGEAFPQEYLAVVEGGIETGQALLEEQFDYIFFSGSIPVGKIVMQAASRYLTPITLELGGKSPCIVHRDAEVEVTARRIAYGKLLNAGQTCVAPDYLLVHKQVKHSLINAMKGAIKDFLGDKPLENPDYPKIVNQKHFERLTYLMKDVRIIVGGETDPSRLSIAPTIIDNPPLAAPLMQEEIFGPLLPVIEFSDLEEAITFVKERPKPLAFYLFSQDRRSQERVLEQISAGGGCINDTIFHLVSPYLPFGGVGASGMGSYHGKASFDTFSHRKSVLKRGTFTDPSLRYHPYTDRKLRFLKFYLGRR